MLRITTGRRTHSPAILVAALALTLTAYTPAAAFVRFEPTPEPVPDRWAAEVDVAVEWAGVSMRVPASWSVRVKREPSAGLGSGASLLSAFGPGDTLCMLEVFAQATLESWQDVGVAAADELMIAGHRTERFDDMWGTGSGVTSAYSIYADDLMYSLMCTADRAPTDRWLSIVETIEFGG